MRTRRLATLIAGFACLIWSAPARSDDAGFAWADALHDSFSQDTFYAAGFDKPLGPPDPIRPFAEPTLQRDSQTEGGILPQTLNDNYGLLAAGIQVQSNSGLRVFAQLGTSFDLGPAIQPLPSLSHFDVRGGADYYRSWNDAPEGKNRYYGAFFGNVVYYSRYQNALLYFEATREARRSCHLAGTGSQSGLRKRLAPTQAHRRYRATPPL